MGNLYLISSVSAPDSEGCGSHGHIFCISYIDITDRSYSNE